MLVGSYVGVNMEECIPLDGRCNWTVSTGDWASVPLATEEFPPLQLSGREIILSLYSGSMRHCGHSVCLLNLKFNFVGSRDIHRASEKVFSCD
jgi:hypothetical protein